MKEEKVAGILWQHLSEQLHKGLISHLKLLPEGKIKPITLSVSLQYKSHPASSEGF